MCNFAGGPVVRRGVGRGLRCCVPIASCAYLGPPTHGLPPHAPTLAVLTTSCLPSIPPLPALASAAQCGELGWLLGGCPLGVYLSARAVFVLETVAKLVSRGV